MKRKIRKTRKDASVETASKKHGIPEDSFRNISGRKTRKDAKIGTLRKRHK